MKPMVTRRQVLASVAARGTQAPRTSLWMGGAFLVGLIIALITLLHFGSGDRGTRIALQLTARWSYGFFSLAYLGGPLVTIFGSRFQPLARRGRELGLAFASAHLTHAGLVVWIYHISRTPPIGVFGAIFFSIALGFTYLLALLSIPTLAARLPRWLWRAILIVGMEFIAYAFLTDFLGHHFGHGLEDVIFYLPFTMVAVAAALLRITAYGIKLYRWFRSGSRRDKIDPLSPSQQARSPASRGAAPAP